MYDDDIDHVARNDWLNRMWVEAVAPLYERLGIDNCDDAFVQAKQILDDYYEGDQYAIDLLKDFTEDELVILEGGTEADDLLENEALERTTDARVDTYFY